MKNYKHIGLLLKEARKEQGLNQRALGMKVGLPQSHISKIEGGIIDLQTSSLIELSRALNLELILIPRTLIPIVEALKRDSDLQHPEPRPMYHLDDENVHAE